ncbi:MAG: DEAD/DEAH box helicase, partial [Bacteroidota bacterium]|nr:DEAD/DEAH box helicase [Bacteroidota bacterium]
MELDTFRNHFLDEENVNEISSLLVSGQSLSLKNISGSLYALNAYAVIEKTEGFHLFILPDKESALYHYNDLENIIQNQRGTTLLFYPASFRRPYQIMEADATSVLQRTEVINSLDKQRKKVIIITYPEAIIEKVIDRSSLNKQCISLHKEEQIDLDFLNEMLIELQFEKVDYVYEPGQFAIRGGILDVYSFGHEYPFRVEFFGDDIESIREFDPENQLSIHTHQKIKIIPNINHNKIAIKRISFLDHLPKKMFIWGVELEVAETKMKKGFETANQVYEKIEDKSSVLLPIEMYLSPLDFNQKISQFVNIQSGNLSNQLRSIDFASLPQPSFNKNFEFLVEKLKQWKENDYIVFICAEQESQLKRLKHIFNELDQHELCSFVQLGIHEGFIDNKNKKVVFTDHQIFERYHRFSIKKTIKKAKESFTLKEVYNLNKGDFVVHIDHGIGEFSGLEKIDVQGKTQEAIRLLYKGGDILYVSIHSLHRITKYANKEGTAPVLNKLGSGAWAMAKQKAKKKIKEVAYDLIQLYAKRKMQHGFSFQPDSYLQNELEASFIYEDTPDQLKATNDVKVDMESISPMDRLICGDVGFGKTEIAIRAAFKAVADNKQVAILAPTTVLVFQHFKTFSERLKDFPCHIDYLNRFKSTKKTKQTIEDLKNGKTDIIIGTHRLIGKDINFKDLGLLIIDEEQKFGVGVKDQLKNLKVNVDTLTLTATPIPRTLQFSLMNARDLSIINTPPPNRFPVETTVQTFSEDTIRDAISYEIDRSGQVFFIHNRVQNIEEIRHMVERLCPHVKVAVGHGQMEGKKLEAVILDFMDGMYDVLVATTIV